MGKRVKASNAESGSSGVKERRKRPRPLLEQIDEGEKQLATGSGVGESKFAKALGSTDFHTREKGLAALTRLACLARAPCLFHWLPVARPYATKLPIDGQGLTSSGNRRAVLRWLASKSQVQEDDLLKLWKGIFYCFWHSDKAPVQVQPSSLRFLVAACLSHPSGMPLENRGRDGLRNERMCVQEDLAKRLAEAQLQLKPRVCLLMRLEPL